MVAYVTLQMNLHELSRSLAWASLENDPAPVGVYRGPREAKSHE